MGDAKRGNADILLMPECFITSYELPVTNEEAIDENHACIKKNCLTLKLTSLL